MNEFLNSLAGEMMRDSFERDGLEETLGCGAERAREMVEVRRARQLAAGKKTLDVLRVMRAEIARQLESGSLGGRIG